MFGGVVGIGDVSNILKHVVSACTPCSPMDASLVLSGTVKVFNNCLTGERGLNELTNAFVGRSSVYRYVA